MPEVAAREHVKNIIPTLSYALRKGKTRPKDIDRIAVTSGPGLMTSLSVGVQTAATLSYAWRKPAIGVNHMEGHIYANWVENPRIRFPVLNLTVSGGHTELVYMKKHGSYKLLGRTRDDASGEAFDKVAKILGLSYPGGPSIEKLAKKGNPKAYDFPRPMMSHANYDFSFAGLKTSVLYMYHKIKKTPKVKADIAASFQQAVVDVLVDKTIKAAGEYKVKTVLLSGGVAANTLLRQTLTKELKSEFPKIAFHYPPIKLCTDNATMIAVAGYFNINRGKSTPWQQLHADSNWELV